jgi:hypothetical protein
MIGCGALPAKGNLGKARELSSGFSSGLKKLEDGGGGGILVSLEEEEEAEEGEEDSMGSYNLNLNRLSSCEVVDGIRSEGGWDMLG